MSRPVFLRQCVAAISLLAFTTSTIATPWINEFHYDNVGTDSGEFIEIAAASGFDITGWTLWRYNGAVPNAAVTYGNGASGTGTAAGVLLSDFSFTAANDSNGVRFYSFNFAQDGIQNGNNDGFALVGPSGFTGGINGGQVLQYLSYEGVISGTTNGPAAGLSSVDIGVSENGVPVGFSLQLGGTGNAAAAFSWQGAIQNTIGKANTNQIIQAGGGGGGGTSTVAIYTIQGAQQRSPLENTSVITSGIVTAVTSNGFYLQDPTGDGNVNTSDAIFVFTGTRPSVAVGDSYSVAATVSEFTQSTVSGSLSVTQLVRPTLTFVSANNTLPAATLIGAGGRLPPTSKIDSDNFGTFNPAVDGVDFYESLEGMRITVADASAVSPTVGGREFYVVANRGAGATGINARGGITLSATDFNPERIQIDAALLGGVAPNVNVGDRFGDITGVVGYFNGNFEVLPTAVNVTSGGLQRTVASVPSGGDRLTVASYNVQMLDTSDPARFATLAGQIKNNLKNPDIIALQEIKESGDTRTVGAAIIAGLAAQGVTGYAYADGGAAGSNGGTIRTGYLYRTDRVSLPGGTIVQDDAVFDNFRPALQATFVFNGQEVTLINNHFAAKLGSTPLYGTTQPPINGREAIREAQAQFVNNLVDSILATNPNANVIVLGDLNEFSFSRALANLRGTGAAEVLYDLADRLLDPLNAYDYNFEGNSQLLDHILVSARLLGLDPRIQIMRINSEFWDQFADHDPLLASFLIAVPEGSTLTLILVGFGGVALARRRRRRLTAAA